MRLEDRRKFERFTLALPAEIEVVSTGEVKESFDLLSRDVSAGGVFCLTTKPVAEGTQVRVRLIVGSHRLEELTGCRGSLQVGGTVVRSEPTGMAICFDENYDFVRIGSLDKSGVSGIGQ